MPLVSYLTTLVVPILVGIGLWLGGWWTWLHTAVIFGVVPIIELFVTGSTHNVDPSQEAGRSQHWLSHLILASILPIQLALVVALLLRAEHLAGWELMGATLGTGSAMGAIGINGAHELGHKRSRVAQWAAEATLALTLYLHFSVEHNRGHHAKVATPEDPASARKGQTVYGFWWQSLVGCIKSAWVLERDRLKRVEQGPWTLRNALVRAVTIQTVMVAGLFLVCPPRSVLIFMAASLISILHLETVNYLQHYGLQRKRTEKGGYERVNVSHSWTSNHPVTRALLIELPRHADHHAAAGRHFANLRHLPESPVLPVGYAGLMVLALIPPAFMKVMHAHPVLQATPSA